MVLKATLTFLLSFFVSGFAFSQEKIHKTGVYVFYGAGVSYYHYNYRVFNQKIHGRYYRFVAPTLRVGIGIERSLSKQFKIKAGLNVGLRFKRDNLYPDPKQGAVVEPYSFFELDRIASTNYYTIELPLSFEYRVSENTYLRAGGICRRLPDYNIPDIGLSLAASRNIGKDMKIGIEYFAAINTRFDGSYYVHNDFGQEIRYTPKNRFAQFTLEYTLGKSMQSK